MTAEKIANYTITNYYFAYFRYRLPTTRHVTVDGSCCWELYARAGCSGNRVEFNPGHEGENYLEIRSAKKVNC
jgi:hypothetical protein